VWQRHIDYDSFIHRALLVRMISVPSDEFSTTIRNCWSKKCNATQQKGKRDMLSTTNEGETKSIKNQQAKGQGLYASNKIRSTGYEIS